MSKKQTTFTQLKLLAQRVNGLLVYLNTAKQNKLGGHSTSPATRLVVCDANGNIYYRTVEEFLSDIGAVTQSQMTTAINTAIANAMANNITIGSVDDGTKIMNGTYDYG